MYDWSAAAIKTVRRSDRHLASLPCGHLGFLSHVPSSEQTPSTSGVD
jgi:hypothetical protein